MTTTDSSILLRRTLLLDAAVSGTTGVVMALGAAVLEPWLAIPGALFRVAGVSLLPFAALLIALATRPTVPKSAIAAVIVANALWVVASIALLASGQVAPTMLGYVVVVVQAVAVLGFAELQWIGLRRLGGPSVAIS